MTYQEQLNTQEWQSKRNEILERDQSKCTKCSIERTPFLHLASFFGVKSGEELKDSGYSFVEISGIKQNNDTIMVSKGNFINVVKYIGETNIDFEPSRMKYGMLYEEIKIGFVVQKRIELVCFYPETLDKYNTNDLNIHHKFYIKGRKAWQYSNDALETLCFRCHQKTHEENEIPVYDEFDELIGYYEACDRCEGSGYLSEYSHVQNGVCFKCYGEGVDLSKLCETLE